jgi:hypothetical protein
VEPPDLAGALVHDVAEAPEPLTPRMAVDAVLDYAPVSVTRPRALRQIAGGTAWKASAHLSFRQLTPVLN